LVSFLPRHSLPEQLRAARAAQPHARQAQTSPACAPTARAGHSVAATMAPTASANAQAWGRTWEGQTWGLRQILASHATWALRQIWAAPSTWALRATWVLVAIRARCTASSRPPATTTICARPTIASAVAASTPQFQSQRATITTFAPTTAVHPELVARICLTPRRAATVSIAPVAITVRTVSARVSHALFAQADAYATRLRTSASRASRRDLPRAMTEVIRLRTSVPQGYRLRHANASNRRPTRTPFSETMTSSPPAIRAMLAKIALPATMTSARSR
jgi:hypothetical protein